MNLNEQAAYLASILAILDNFDDNSTQRPAWLVDEYKRVWDQWKEGVAEERKKDEQRREQRRQHEARTAVEQRRSGERASGHVGGNEREPGQSGERTGLPQSQS